MTNRPFASTPEDRSVPLNGLGDGIVHMSAGSALEATQFTPVTLSLEVNPRSWFFRGYCSACW